MTSKVGFYPADADGTNTWVPIEWTASNCKGKQTTPQAVDECLELLGLEYVDLMLIHNPAAELTRVSCFWCSAFLVRALLPFVSLRDLQYSGANYGHLYDCSLLSRRLFHDPNDKNQPDFTEAERTAFLEARKELACKDRWSGRAARTRRYVGGA